MNSVSWLISRTLCNISLHKWYGYPVEQQLIDMSKLLRKLSICESKDLDDLAYGLGNIHRRNPNYGRAKCEVCKKIRSNK